MVVAPPPRPDETSPLFDPVQVGNMTLSHRIVMAPMTRHRADGAHIHVDGLASEYYGQRSCTPGTLLITEGTLVGLKAGGYENVPGIWAEEQIQAWKKITNAVHVRGSYIFLQLWAMGRTASLDVLKREGFSKTTYVSASKVRLSGYEDDPRALTVAEIKDYVEMYAQAARNAIEAGFDGVEIQGGNGYLIDQFIQDLSNKRTDEYGGGIENRNRFALEVVKAVVDAVGEKRTGIRLSPWSKLEDMGMVEPVPTFSHLITTIRDTYPNFAYIHMIESTDITPSATSDESMNEFAREIWGKRPYIANSGFKRDSAMRWAKTKGDIVSFARDFISNPDLVRRLQEDLALTPFDQPTFYGPPASPRGYIDYKFYMAPSRSSSSNSLTVPRTMGSKRSRRKSMISIKDAFSRLLS